MRLEEALVISERVAYLAAEQPLSRGPSIAAAIAQPQRATAIRRIGVGVAPGKHVDDWRVAVRAWTESDLIDLGLEDVHGLHKSEIDIRITGRIRVLNATPLGQLIQPCRPLRAGYSIGHAQVSAGTLGAFVECEDGRVRILSNNHVLANTNRGQTGDHLLQPGTVDGGRAPKDVVGQLNSFVRLLPAGNHADAALGDILSGFGPNDTSLPGIGLVVGYIRSTPPIYNVYKVGRTTNVTSGRITALNLRSIPIDYDEAEYRFDGVLEVQGNGGNFADHGDSGALVVDKDRQAVGLLFAVDDTAAYLNPISDVMALLKVRRIL